MQISTFKLSDFELGSGVFLMQNTLQITHFNNYTQKIVEYMQPFLQIRFSILY